MSVFTPAELKRFAEGSYAALYRRLGAHPTAAGCAFSVWAPRARKVQVVGEVAPRGRTLTRSRGGVWSGWIPAARRGQTYRLRITGADRREVEKADPFAVAFRDPARPDALVPGGTRRWRDGAWMRRRGETDPERTPLSVYEVHMGSWRRSAGGGFLGYRRAARELAAYARDLGFTHVELLPVAEHPYYGSWGYQATGYFAPTARYGSPDDLKAAIEILHRAGLGVILDWVPSHFVTDDHGLVRFDGGPRFEHPDPRRSHHPDWDSAIFDYDSGEVRSFLLSSARWWLEEFHVDGLRVDAVASMLYLDYSRAPGEWIPNRYGSNESLGALELLRSLNRMVREEFPGVLVIAEESTAWPGVTRAEYLGGLGFDLKWDMGWMHDTLGYLRRDPAHRRYHHGELTFRMIYAFSERFMLALSHDEVVHLKGALAAKMPGDKEARLAQLRLLFGYMWALPGKKLLFMGGELGQESEWDHERELPWELLRDPAHRGVQRWVRDLNRLLGSEPALHARDFEPGGFGWVDPDDSENSVLSFLRYDESGERPVLAVANFTPVARPGYRVGVPWRGRWRTLLNSDARRYGGSGRSPGRLNARPRASHGFDSSLTLDLPPYGLVLAGRVGRF